METSPNATPFFSVVIPLFNKRNYIVRAIEGVLNQKFRDFELIIVDDGSTDESATAVEQLIGGRNGCSLVRQENQGGSGGPARNRGMMLGRGEWFALLDADDLWLPNHLSELMRVISDCPSARLVSSSSTELWEGARQTADRRSRPSAGYVNYFIEASDNDRCVHSSSVAVHRSVPASVGYFSDARSGQDLEYWARIALTFPVARSSRRTSIYYRGNGGNMETLAAENKLKGPGHSRTVRCISDVSPSLALIERRAISDPALFRRADIQRYINSRIDKGIRVRIVGEDMSDLSSLVALKFPPKTLYSLAVNMLASVPTSRLMQLERARKWIKSRTAA